jgi:hypothetical protein
VSRSVAGWGLVAQVAECGPVVVVLLLPLRGVGAGPCAATLPGSLILKTTWQTHTGWLIVVRGARGAVRRLAGRLCSWWRDVGYDEIAAAVGARFAGPGTTIEDIFLSARGVASVPCPGFSGSPNRIRPQSRFFGQPR